MGAEGAWEDGSGTSQASWPFACSSAQSSKECLSHLPAFNHLLMHPCTSSLPRLHKPALCMKHKGLLLTQQS